MFAEWCQCVSTVSRQLELYSQKGHIFTAFSRLINETFCAQASPMKIQPFHFEERHFLHRWAKLFWGTLNAGFQRAFQGFFLDMSHSEQRYGEKTGAQAQRHFPRIRCSPLLSWWWLRSQIPLPLPPCPWHLFREMCKKQGMYEVICSQIYCCASDSLHSNHITPSVP